MKKFRVQTQIGKAKYVVTFHDGIKKHPDGSEFYDITTFKNKKKLNLFVISLLDSGYINE